MLASDPNGKLIVRICSRDDLPTAFVKAPGNPLSASKYNQFGIRVPYEKIFIARYNGCVKANGLAFNQYWLETEPVSLKYDEIISVTKVKFTNYYLYEFDYHEIKNKSNRYKAQNADFEKNITEFVNMLLKNSDSTGFIVHNSKRKEMRRHIERVKFLLAEAGVAGDKYSVIKNPKMDLDNGNEDINHIETNDKAIFPRLSVVEIRR